MVLVEISVKEVLDSGLKKLRARSGAGAHRARRSYSARPKFRARRRFSYTNEKNLFF